MHKSSRKSAKVSSRERRYADCRNGLGIKAICWKLVGREGISHSLQWGNAIGEPYRGNPYVRFDEGTEAVRPPPTLQEGARLRERLTSSRLGLIQLLALQFQSCQR